MYNLCLVVGRFPDLWKEATLVLSSKERGQAEAASSYRFLCILDTAEKFLEKMLRQCLHEALCAVRDLVTCQYDFVLGRSTIDAEQEVMGNGDGARKSFSP